LLLRFLVVAPAGLLWPRFHTWLVVHASSLSMNVKYRRQSSTEINAWVRRWEASILLVWITAAAIAWGYGARWKMLGLWYGVSACASVCNALRTLGAHRYESHGTPLDREGQLRDSIDTPGNVWTTLWAPVGLRFHALHHYFPGIPYHNLGQAYRRIISGLPEEAGYQDFSSPGLARSLFRLYRNGRIAEREKRDSKLYAHPPLRFPGN
jgi:fatty acid desaturase